MKRCPKCNTDYFDNMLEFCLEDGERLNEFISKDEELKTVPSLKTNIKTKEPETVVLDEKNFKTNKISPQTVKNIKENKESLDKKSVTIKESLTEKGLKILELTPIILALCHNYWQWLYLVKSQNSKLSDFLTSVEFIVWFLLLITSVFFGIISLKYSKNKSFAIISLVILAINFLLAIVPK